MAAVKEVVTVEIAVVAAIIYGHLDPYSITTVVASIVIYSQA